MTAKPFRVSLKPAERIYVNGAVIRVDRRVTLEFLNDVQFLLENHVLQAEQAVTPLRQLYFIVQVMVMAPNDADAAKRLFRERLRELFAEVVDRRVLTELKTIDQWVAEERYFQALKLIRALFAEEARSALGGHESARKPGLSPTAVAGIME